MTFTTKSIVYLVLLTSAHNIFAKDYVNGDFLLRTYEDEQKEVYSFDLYSKLADRNIFFNMTCNLQAAFPTIRLLFLNDEVFSESPKLLQAQIKFPSKVMSANGILSYNNNYNDVSNKIRLEWRNTSSMQEINERFASFINLMKTENKMSFHFSHRSFSQTIDHQFSLKGINKLITPYENLCR